LLLSRLAVLLTSVLLMCSTVQAYSAPPETIDKLTSEWLALERQKQSLTSQWQIDETTLKQRITLLKQQREQLEHLIDKAKRENTEVDQKRETLLAEQEQLETRQAQVERFVAALTSQINAKRPSFPNPLSKALPDLTADGKSIVSSSQPNVTDQLQRLTQAIEQMNQFNQTLSTHEGIIQVSHKKMRVDQLYAGYDYAWFVNRDNTQSGYGRLIDNKWQWQFFEPERAKPSAIRQAIDMLDNKALPDYISLPISFSPEQAIGEQP